MKTMYDNPSTKNFVGVIFTCCNVYGRVYKNKEGTAYVGRCPKCLKSIRMKIGQGGCDSRFFYAG